MESWDGWELGRVVVLFASAFYVGIWIQVTLMHWAAAFRRWEMYGPVIATPFIVALGALGAVDGEGLFAWVAAAAFAVGVLEGLAGTYFHLRGTGYMTGGLTVRNLMAGPPPVLPLAYALVGILGLMGLFLHD